MMILIILFKIRKRFALKNYLSTLIFFLLSCSVYSQPTLEWEARYNGQANNADVVNAMCKDAFSNIYVTGKSADASHYNDIVTIKYNSSGDSLWTRRYNGPNNFSDEALAICVDNSSNVYITGKSFSVSGLDDFVTIKYNSSGVLQWVRTYGGNLNDFANAIGYDALGNVYVTGGSTGANGFDYVTIKYSPAGDSVWVRKYNFALGNSSDIASSIAVDNSGNIYVTGTSWGGSSNYDYATIKYNSMGVQQWVSRYNGISNSSDRANMLVIDQTGNVYVTGGSTGPNGFDYVTLKYNPSGDSLWVKRYNGTANGDDRANAICIDNSGNVYVTGESRGIGTFADYVTIKYNSSGDSLWSRRYNGLGNENDFANSIGVDNSGNVYVTGESRGLSNRDYTTIKYNSMGVEQWVDRYNGPGNNNDIATSLLLDSLGNLYVSGASAGIGTNLDYTTLKYNQTVGIQPIYSEIPTETKLLQNYPNPFNPGTYIKFGIHKPSNVVLSVYNQLGESVAELVYQKLDAGEYEYYFEASNLSSGVYYYRVTADDQTSVKKMILIK
jgi:uncharacterized delta-60 repeat protein